MRSLTAVGSLFFVLALACSGPEDELAWKVEEGKTASADGVADAEAPMAEADDAGGAAPPAPAKRAAKAEAEPQDKARDSAPAGWPTGFPTEFVEMSAQPDGTWVIFEPCDAQVQRRRAEGTRWVVMGGHDAFDLTITEVSKAEGGVRLELTDSAPVTVAWGDASMSWVTIDEPADTVQRWVPAPREAEVTRVVQPVEQCEF